MEFPGNPVAPPTETFSDSTEEEYAYLKSNVEVSSMLQCAFSLYTRDGRQPANIHTWQYNMFFDRR